MVANDSPNAWKGLPCWKRRIQTEASAIFPACNVLYVNSVEMESLTGPQAVAKAISETLAAAAPPTATVVHFKVSSQGITLTDNQRK